VRARLVVATAFVTVGLCAAPARAHPTIGAGDVAVVAVYSNPSTGAPSFSFVTLAAFHPVEVVTFTDRGWEAAGRFRAGEGLAYWDVDRFVAEGTVIERPSMLSLEPGDDSIVAFVGALMPDGTPTDTLLFGIRLGGPWDADATSDATSAMPPSLAGYELAVSGGLDCAYAGPTVGSRAALLARIGDPSEWTCSDVERPAAPAAFTVYRDLGATCVGDADCGPGVFCAYGVCCDSECRRDEAGHCLTCDFGLGDARTGHCGAAPTTYLCRLGAGPCDPADRCDGVSPECPPNAPLGPAEVCRPSVGGCDPAEVCDGVSPRCPPDVSSDPGAVCRPSDDPCDLEEVCGDGVECPPDDALADGAPCDDGLVCTASSACVDGRCAGPVPLECDDDDPCTADACADDGGCTHAPIDGCCGDDAACDDGDPCTLDRCAERSCVSAPAPGCADAGAGVDASVAIDAGSARDAGAPPEPAPACACRAASPRRPPPSAWCVALFLGGMLRGGVSRIRRRGG